MAGVSHKDVVDQLLAILDEAFEHPEKPWSYFTDPSPDAGYFGTLAKLSAAEAQQASGATSIAAQVSHVIFALEASSAFIAGDPNPPGLEKWQQSWQLAELDDEAWFTLQAKLRDTYQNLRTAIEAHAVSHPHALGGAIGAIAHAAYHLGAIRQKLALLEAS